MKKFKLLLISLIVSASVFSQEEYIKDKHGLYNIIYGTDITYNTMTTYTNRTFDTIKCVLLVCDTSRPYQVWTSCAFDSLTSNGWVGHPVFDTVFSDYHRYVYWMFGFEVVEKIEYMVGDYMISHTEYLDKNKNKLNLVVWQHINL